ncbi:hypothetical protein LX64_02826 [Chitinophaga skermanii]|uniref:Uncharacterized protein n=1 Tax=Chitinophaga skermanii TaxID=331697 RepID=A0A327QHD2_9BACT|nr:hypothetical protein [Chitinophaga skermanii]RAJ03949.1 hypothetical protein LX64_02826 [Chitinophaga skermanii]
MHDDFGQRWKALEEMLTERFGKTPNMEAILFLIGVQELQKFKKKYTKEQKQDLMHIAVCTLLSLGGYFEFEGLDNDGWPHFKEVSPVPKMGLQEQEHLLKEYVLEYFEVE